MMRNVLISRLEMIVLLLVVGYGTHFVVSGMVETRINGNEASAIASVQELVNAEMLYVSASESKEFGSLSDLERLRIIGPSLKGGVKDGYLFNVKSNGAEGFSVTALPIRVGVTGRRGFFSDQTGVIRCTADGTAPDSSSSLLESNPS